MVPLGSLFFTRCYAVMVAQQTHAADTGYHSDSFREGELFKVDVSIADICDMRQTKQIKKQH